MKLFPAKCHERATLQKLWRQTGNSSLLPAKCWPLLHVIRGGLMLSLESQRVFQNLLLFCFAIIITNHLMTGPEGNSEFCFPLPIEILGKQNSLFPSGPVIKHQVFTWKFRNQILLSSIEKDKIWSTNGLLLGWKQGVLKICKWKRISSHQTYLLLTEFEGRTVSYGPSFFLLHLRPKREARGP